jgi:6-phosphofructokinase 2
MARIVTLTPNPAIDLSTSLDRVVPTHKLRCATPRRDPGGGGVNVARVVRRFGGDVEAIFPAGGMTGPLLRRLIDAEGIPNRIIESEAGTREDFFVSERSSGLQYRFVLPGEPLRETEWRACLAALAATTPAPEFVVASGSLPPGVPSGFYAEAAAIAHELGAKFLLDTSGMPLKAAVDHSLYLIKPNLDEMSELTGSELATQDDWLAAARTMIATKKIEIIALSLGHLGGLLVTRGQVLRAQALPIRPVSAVGAGDSFLGALVFGLTGGATLTDALRLAVAAGAAALLNEGTELCRPADVRRLAGQVRIEQI